MSYKIELTESFSRATKKLAKKHSSLVADLIQFRQQLLEDPTQGVALGNDCYKVRLKISSKGKGKSGGARVITCVKIVGETIYLLAIYDKSDKETLAENELDLLLKQAGL